MSSPTATPKTGKRPSDPAILISQPKLRRKKTNESQSVCKMPPISTYSPSVASRDLLKNTYKHAVRRPSPFSQNGVRQSRPESKARSEDLNTNTRARGNSMPANKKLAQLRIETESDSKDQNASKPTVKSTTNNKSTMNILATPPTPMISNRNSNGNRPISLFGLAHQQQTNLPRGLSASNIRQVKNKNIRVTSIVTPGHSNHSSKIASLAISDRKMPEALQESMRDTRKPSEEDEFNIPDIGATKHSLKGSGAVKAYAANTHKGLVRDYNEDRVSIILNISKPATSKYQGVWPACSYFAIFDGHGGETCAEFLRDNLHQMVVRNDSFPLDPVTALERGCAEAEAKFMEKAQSDHLSVDRSGSCAIIVLIVDDMCYVANVGDSRAIMSCERGKKIVDMSRDHKPSDENEKARIIMNGGKVYQTQIPQPFRAGASGIFASSFAKVINGPMRVLPGRLSVSRTFGDIEAKQPFYNGNPNVVIAEPEIQSFKLTDDCDFIVLGCDGIFDKLTSEEAGQSVWNSTLYKFDNIHQQTAAGVEYLMKNSLLKKTLDNITVVTIALSGLENAFMSKTSLAPSQEELPGSESKLDSLLSYRMPINQDELDEKIEADIERKSTHDDDSLIERSSVTTTTSILHIPASKSHFSSASLNKIKHLEAIRNASYNNSSKSLKSIKTLLMGKGKKKV